jgi:hypothetical protein
MESLENSQAEPNLLRSPWAVKLKYLPDTRSLELKITLPVGEEDLLTELLDSRVNQAFPEMFRALASGRVPGNEIELGAHRPVL